MNIWQGKNILVIGAARQGLAASRFLASHGANVLLNDHRPQTEFKSHRADLDHLGIKTHFGGHPLELLKNIDLVCISGGVPLDLPIIEKAIKNGISLTNDSQIFLQALDASVIGITGSAGKTTTTILCGEIAKSALQSPRKVWVGGNIGYPLIEKLEEIHPEDWAVVELSSFQLELMTVSPHIALVVNITPNHLDRHKSMEAYTAAKAHILQYQTKDDIAILNRDDPGSIGLSREVKGKMLTFGFEPLDDLDGSFVENNSIKMRYKGKVTQLVSLNNLHLPGRHNVANALAACTTAFVAGFSAEAMQAGIQSVKAIPHRLELVRERNGVRWYNDSIATAPERVIAALHAIKGPLVLLLGGRDKDLPWESLALLLNERQPKVILFGEASNLIADILWKTNPFYPLFQVEKLEDAVAKAAEIAQEGECVLLSPGGTSFDAFRDFEERGECYRRWVKELS